MLLDRAIMNSTILQLPATQFFWMRKSDKGEVSTYPRPLGAQPGSQIWYLLMSSLMPQPRHCIRLYITVKYVFDSSPAVLHIALTNMDGM